MKKILLSTFLFITLFSNAQQDKKANDFRFYQFELALPFTYNPEHTEEKTNWFVPDGVHLKAGYGVDYDQTFGISLHTGFDYKAKQKVANIPIYANVRFSPEVGDNANFTFEYGVGKAFAINKGISGIYQNVKFGIITQMKYGLYLEWASYGYKIADEKLSYLSVGFVVYGM
jgi:hypothetical protein